LHQRFPSYLFFFFHGSELYFRNPLAFLKFVKIHEFCEFFLIHKIRILDLCSEEKHSPSVTACCRLSGAGVLGLIGVVASTRRLPLKPHPDSGVKMLLSDGLTQSVFQRWCPPPTCEEFATEAAAAASSSSTGAAAWRHRSRDRCRSPPPLPRQVPAGRVGAAAGYVGLASRERACGETDREAAPAQATSAPRRVLDWPPTREERRQVRANAAGVSDLRPRCIVAASHAPRPASCGSPAALDVPSAGRSEDPPGRPPCRHANRLSTRKNCRSARRVDWLRVAAAADLVDAGPAPPSSSPPPPLPPSIPGSGLPARRRPDLGGQPRPHAADASRATHGPQISGSESAEETDDDSENTRAGARRSREA